MLTFISSVEILGHSASLNVEYDECSKIKDNTEDDEKWYIFWAYHISENINEIKYYISNVGKDIDGEDVYWNSTGLTNEQINQLKSDNGSYVLSNGIVVLVDSDIESYLNNTLIFRNPNEDIM